MKKKFSKIWFPITIAKYLIAMIIASAVISQHAIAIELKSQTLRYSVDYRGTDAGALNIEVIRNGDNYTIKAVSDLSLVAQLFLKSYTIETQFSSVNSNVSLLSGKESLNQSGETIREFMINQEAREVEYKDADNVKFDAATRVDADAFPLGMILSKTDELIGKPFLSVSPKRARLFVVKEAAQEEVTVPAGTFNTTLIKSVRPDDKNRFVQIWLKSGDNPVPVKIVSGKPGKVTTLTLTK